MTASSGPGVTAPPSPLKEGKHMDVAEIADRLEHFLRESFAIAEDDPGFNRSVDLFDSGYVDSVGLVETLAFITSSFGVNVPDEALLSDAFATIDGMAHVIEANLKKADIQLAVTVA